MTNSINTIATNNTTSTIIPLDTVIYLCKHCNQAYLELDRKYVDENPSASDMCVEKAFDRHVSGPCPNSHEYDVVDVCPDCGVEIWRGDREYVMRCPNGSDMARSMAALEHNYECPASLSTQWNEWKSVYGDTTPRQLLEKVYSEKGPKACFDIMSPPDRIILSGGNEYDTWEDEVDEFILEKYSFKGSPQDVPQNWPTWKCDKWPVTSTSKLVPDYIEVGGVIFPKRDCYFRWNGDGIHPSRRSSFKDGGVYSFYDIPF